MQKNLFVFINTKKLHKLFILNPQNIEMKNNFENFYKLVPVAKSRSPIAGLVTVPTTPSPTPEREVDKNITIFPTKTISYKNLIISKIVKKNNTHKTNSIF